MAVVHSQQHRKHPDSRPGDEAQYRHAPRQAFLPAAGIAGRRRPRQASAAHGSRTSKGRKPTPLVTVPSPAAKNPATPSASRDPQQVTRQSIQRERGHGTSTMSICPRFACRPNCRQTNRARDAYRRLPAPEPCRQIVGQPQRKQRGQQRRQQEGDPPLPGQPVCGGLQPHEDGRLFRIELNAPVREQPLPGFHHVAGGQHEPRLIRGRGIAQAQSGQQAERGQKHEDEEAGRSQTSALQAGRQGGRTW